MSSTPSAQMPPTRNISHQSKSRIVLCSLTVQVSNFKSQISSWPLSRHRRSGRIGNALRRRFLGGCGLRLHRRPLWNFVALVLHRELLLFGLALLFVVALDDVAGDG